MGSGSSKSRNKAADEAGVGKDFNVASNNGNDDISTGANSVESAGTSGAALRSESLHSNASVAVNTKPSETFRRGSHYPGTEPTLRTWAQGDRRALEGVIYDGDGSGSDAGASVPAAAASGSAGDAGTQPMSSDAPFPGTTTARISDGVAKHAGNGNGSGKGGDGAQTKPKRRGVLQRLKRISRAVTQEVSVRKALALTSKQQNKDELFTSDAEKAAHFLDDLAAKAGMSETDIIRIQWMKQAIKKRSLYASKINKVNATGKALDSETHQYLKNSLDMHLDDDDGDSGPVEAAEVQPASAGSRRMKRASSTVKVAQHLRLGGLRRPERRKSLDDLDSMSESIPAAAKDMLVDIGHWSFDVFDLYAKSDGHPLVAMVYAVVVRLGLVKECKIDLDCLHRFCLAIEEGHHMFPYHSRIHAADVVHGVFWFITTGQLGEAVQLSPHEIYAMLIAAAIHDYDHRGVTNVFLATTEHELALRYNNSSILEAHSCAKAYSLINTPATDPLSGFTKEQRRDARTLIIDCVMATNLSRHGTVLMEFKQHLERFTASSDGSPMAAEPTGLKRSAVKMAIKCADVSNPARPWHLYDEWICRVMMEFFAQGDVEKKLNIQVSPFCDRGNGHVPGDPNSPPVLPAVHETAAKCQQGFINFIVKPLFSAFAKFLPEVANPTNLINENLAQVSKEDASGSKTYRLRTEIPEGFITPTVDLLGLQHLVGANQACCRATVN